MSSDAKRDGEKSGKGIRSLSALRNTEKRWPSAGEFGLHLKLRKTILGPILPERRRLRKL
jgi:hypothetical protein